MSEPIQNVSPMQLVVEFAVDVTGVGWVLMGPNGVSDRMCIPLSGLPTLIEHLQKIQASAPADLEKMRAALAMGEHVGSA